MLRGLAADAIFICAVFTGALAVLSLLHSVHAAALPEALGPVIGFYRAKAVPALAYGAGLLWPSAPQWYADASAIAAILFFLFFIAQARRAMEPYEPAKSLTRIEAVIDWVLPGAICAVGAALTAPLLLPFLTVPAAFAISLGKLAGKPWRFELSRSYYANLLGLTAVAGAALVFPAG